MKGESLCNQTETMAWIHNIHNIMPGAIATCGVLVCVTIGIDVSAFLILLLRLTGPFRMTMLFRK